MVKRNKPRCQTQKTSTLRNYKYGKQCTEETIMKIWVIAGEMETVKESTGRTKTQNLQ